MREYRAQENTAQNPPRTVNHRSYETKIALCTLGSNGLPEQRVGIGSIVYTLRGERVMITNISNPSKYNPAGTIYAVSSPLYPAPAESRNAQSTENAENKLVLYKPGHLNLIWAAVSTRTGAILTGRTLP